MCFSPEKWQESEKLLVFASKSESFFSIFQNLSWNFAAKLLVPVMRLQINDIIILTIGAKRGPWIKTFLAKSFWGKTCSGYQYLQACRRPQDPEILKSWLRLKLRLAVLGGLLRSRWCVDRSKPRALHPGGERTGWREGLRPLCCHWTPANFDFNICPFIRLILSYQVSDITSIEIFSFSYFLSLSFSLSYFLSFFLSLLFSFLPFPSLFSLLS